MAAQPVEKNLPGVHCEIIQALQGRGVVNVFVICLDRRGSEHNIIDRQFGLELTQAAYLAGEKAGSGEADVVVVCSAKERSFLAGADIEVELKFIGPEGTRRWVELVGCHVEILSSGGGHVRRLCRSMESTVKAVQKSAVNGQSMLSSRMILRS